MSQEQSQRSKTIGEALEDAAKAIGDSPVDQCDAAAIEAAERRATGDVVVNPGGLAATAQAAATFNAECTKVDHKIKLRDVLSDASSKLAADKVVRKEDAEEVINAEATNNSRRMAKPGGVALAVTAAVKFNEEAYSYLGANRLSIHQP